MSVLIRGMAMPKNCKECPCGYETEGAFRDECSVLAREYEKDADSVRPDWCPLIEIPIPHGRLGDLDKLWDRIYHYTDNEGAKMPFGDNDFMIHRDSACELIEDAPTVIEAEGEKDGR